MAEDLDIDDFIDTSPITRLHLLVAVFGTLVMFVDGFNIQVIGYIAPQLAKDWQIPKQLLGPIFSSGLFGVFCGYLALAPLTSRIGHRKMLIACTVTLGVLTLSTMLVRDAYSLMALRFLTGLALGAANPSAVSIIADFSPRHRRSTFVVIGICGISLGSMFAGLVTTVLLESFGWQAVVFVGGAMPLVLAVGLFASLPDSLEYSALEGGMAATPPRWHLPEGLHLLASFTTTPASSLTRRPPAPLLNCSCRTAWWARRRYGFVLPPISWSITSYRVG